MPPAHQRRLNQVPVTAPGQGHAHGGVVHGHHDGSPGSGGDQSRDHRAPEQAVTGEIRRRPGKETGVDRAPADTGVRDENMQPAQVPRHPSPAPLDRLRITRLHPGPAPPRCRRPHSAPHPRPAQPPRPGRYRLTPQRRSQPVAVKSVRTPVSCSETAQSRSAAAASTARALRPTRTGWPRISATPSGPKYSPPATSGAVAA